jgi:lipopolysaccharide transport system permease protein
MSLEPFDLWIESGGSRTGYWRDLWRYRGLFVILAWRDVAVRYRQTAAGAAWAIIQPALSMLIMTVIFGRVAGLPSESGAPYVLMVGVAMLPWQFFSNAVTATSQSVVGNANMISKVYFPRLIVPGSSLVVCLVDFLVSSLLVVAMMVWFGVAPTWRLLVLPGLVALAAVSALGPGLILTALTVKYRDFRFIVPFIVQFGLYASPVAYSTAVVRDKLGEAWFFVYSLNPMVAVVEGFRWAVLGGGSIADGRSFTLSVGIAVVLFVIGVAYFRRTERTFADVI